MGISPADPTKATDIGKLAAATTITFPNLTSVVLDKTEDISSEIRSSTITSNIGGVAANKQVREALADMQRGLARGDYPETFKGRHGITHNGKTIKGMVMDGRDIGTVILPDAELKVFLIADSQVRAQRRYDEMVKRNKLEAGETVEKIKKELEQRDHEDRTRTVSPLKKADDAVELDTSHLTIPQQVEAIEKLILDRMDKF
jgi:cytidylate kinase